MRDGPEAGLAAIDAVVEKGGLDDYHLAHSARADMLRRLGRAAEARGGYERALSMTRLEPERRFSNGGSANWRSKRTRQPAFLHRARMSCQSITGRTGFG
jgi:predicted RNA polymerase sigma factor